MDLHDPPAKIPPTSLYHALQENEIRSIILRPSAAFSDPIQVSMHTTDFSNQPIYKALSYVWGSPDATTTILVNDVDFQATPNLVSALRHIRHSQLAEVLWVDAICINQLETKERNQQVQMMSRIYESASEVIAWLGESDDDSDAAMGLLSRWGNALAALGIREYYDVRNRGKWFQTGQNAENFIAGIEAPFDERAFSALSNLYARSYWKRLWIFQEFVLAKRVALMCGSKRIEADYLITDGFLACWEEFFPSSGSVGRDEFEMVRNSLLRSRNDRHTIHDLLGWRCIANTRHRGERFFHEAHHRNSLFELLWDTSFRNCSDPRDHIFAMSGFCEEGSPSVVVDYSLSVDETYANFARSCILETHLQVLSFAGIGHNHKPQSSRQGVPSWVPYWGASCRGMGRLPEPLSYIHYSAGSVQGRTDLPHRSGTDKNQIIMQGIIYDTIVEVLEGPSHWWRPRNISWKDILARQSPGNTYVTGVPLLQAYFRTLLADFGPDRSERLERLLNLDEDAEHSNVLPMYGGLVVNFLKQYCIEGNDSLCAAEKERLMAGLEERMDVESLEMGSFFRENENPSLARWTQWLQNARKHEIAFQNAQELGSKARSFFTTTDGYMGTGPPFAKKGDIVCIFQDANVPFLLRKGAEGHRLVGEAFVLGLMDGESTGSFEDIILY